MFTDRRRQSRLGTLERRLDFHLSEAVRAALQGSHEKARTHSGTALSIGRELYTGAQGPARHQGNLAAALCNHARYGSTTDAIALLAESAGHYAALAAADPARYEIPRIDVLTRIAVASDAAGNAADAINLLREVIAMYQRAREASPAERDLGHARARFHLGRCLLVSGDQDAGLGETDAGLALAVSAVAELGITPRDPLWVGRAPRYVQQAAPDWAAAAVRSMVAHSAAGHAAAAAAAATIAVQVSAGLAEFGGAALSDAHQVIRARAEALLTVPQPR